MNRENELRWFAPPLKMSPLAARRCLVRNPLNGVAAELESGEYAVLSTCEGCLTLAEHEARAAQRLAAPSEHRPAIRALLESCARRGLLVSLQDLVARFATTTARETSPIAGVTIPTADRPQMLGRLLRGASELQRRTGVAYSWYVFDDSRGEDCRRRNRDEIASCPDLRVTYHDLSLADSLERRLAAALPELREEIGWLLAAGRPDEYTSGRPVNHQLLRFAGRRYLSMDDDVLVQPRRPPLTRSGVDVGLAEKVATWYGSFDDAFAACPELPLDPFAEHAQWLGVPMAKAWRRAAEREPEGLRTSDLVEIAGGYFQSDARIVFTWNHVLGDPGWARFSGELLRVGAETRDWIAANPGSARLAFESQVHWRGYPSLRLSPQTSLATATLSGFDDTVLLPPAVRTGPEVDTMIGELTRCIHSSAWTVSLPFALPHVRASRRQWLTPTETFAIGRNRLLLGYARRVASSIQARDPAARLATLGSLFVDLAAAGDSTLRGVIDEQTTDMASRLAFIVNEQLDDATTPASWKEALRPWLRSPLLRMNGASETVPLEELRTTAREFGRGLIAWPRLWAHCEERFQ